MFPELDVQTELGAGHPAAVLIGKSVGATLIVLGGRDDGQHRIGNSFALSLASHGHCPVAVVRDRELPEHGPAVVGIGGSPASESALAAAFEEASARGVEIVAVHAWAEFGSDTEYRHAHRLIADWYPIEVEQVEMLAERLAGWPEKYPRGAGSANREQGERGGCLAG